MLSSDERIELRIAVNLHGLSVAEAAERYGVDEGMVLDLIGRSGGHVNPYGYNPNHAMDKLWPELSGWMRDRDMNLSALCREVGIGYDTTARAVRNMELLRERYRILVEKIADYTGLECPEEEG